MTAECASSFDEQLPSSLCGALADVYPDSLSAKDLGLGGAPDEATWRAAIEHACILVTKDEDFHRLSVLRGAPPKVVWIRLGNCTTEAIADLLRHHRGALGDFVRNEDLSFLGLGA